MIAIVCGETPSPEIVAGAEVCRVPGVAPKIEGNPNAAGCATAALRRSNVCRAMNPSFGPDSSAYAAPIDPGRLVEFVEPAV